MISGIIKDNEDKVFIMIPVTLTLTNNFTMGLYDTVENI